MCGILFCSDGNITRDTFIAALKSMIYRGPDAQLCYAEFANYKLGHNRLSILDPNERSNQPFFSEDGKWVIIYNGEIYNYKELTDSYDITLKTSSDTELILKLSLKLGIEKAVRTFNGMFAYVLFNTETHEYFAVRDRLGVKPLYYVSSATGTIFSSEISPILEITGRAEIDPVGLRQYQKLRTFFNGHTFYKDIAMFPAGMIMQRGGEEEPHLCRYWTLPQGDQAPPSDDELRYLVESAVRYRKISDVPVGSFLSGGLDSTIIAALAGEPNTWTVGFSDNNEFTWGRLAARNIGTRHHEVLISKEKFTDTAKLMVTIRKEPLSVPNEVLIYAMSREIKKENTVVLCGEGADELFFGYDRIFRWAASKKSFDIKEFSDLYAYGSADDLEIVESAIEPFYSFGKPLDIVAAFFQIAHLHGLLRRLDSATMLCSVEARSPFVDYRLVERMAGVPYTYRMADAEVKAPLKRIFSDLVPLEIINRKKVGFPVDLKTIFSVPVERAYDAWFSFNITQFQTVLSEIT